jgi:hypothetical protein
MDNLSKHVTRRDFIKHSAAGVAGLAVSETLSPHSSEAAINKIPMRTLGKTGLRVSLLSFGGGSQFLANPDGKWEAMIEQAVKQGINLFDTAPDYQWDNPKSSEERFGDILPPYRDRILLSTKLDSRDVTVALREFERSLTRMKTDYVDLLLIHDLNQTDNPTSIGKGIYREMVRLKEEKVVKYIGFSSMSASVQSKDVIESLDLDVALLALNPTGYGDYVKITLPAARRKNMGVIAMKTMRDIVGTKATAKELLHYVWNLEGVATAVVGHIGSATLDENVRLAEAYGSSGVDSSYLHSMEQKELETRLAHLAGPHALCWARPDYRDRTL